MSWVLVPSLDQRESIQSIQFEGSQPTMSPIPSIDGAWLTKYLQHYILLKILASAIPCDPNLLVYIQFNVLLIYISLKCYSMRCLEKLNHVGKTC